MTRPAPVSRPRPGRAATTTLALVTAVLLAGGGCSSDDQTPSAQPPGAATSASSSSPPSAGESTTSASPSEDGSSVAPATGKVFDATAFTVVVPDGWTGGDVARSPQITTATFLSPDKTTILDLFRTVAPSSPSLEEVAKISLGNTDDPQRLPDREVGGQKSYVFTTDTDQGTTYNVGSVVGTDAGELTLTFAPASVSGVEPDPAAQEALFESILATMQWKG